MIEVGIVGGTGYTGAELLRLLAAHPQVRVKLLTSRKEQGRRADALFPHLRGYCDLSFVVPELDTLATCDAVFFATPHGTAMSLAPQLVAAGVRVIDLSADFRLRDVETFSHWYGMPHSCPDLLAESVYGLPEVNRAQIREARVVANPGCYPTAVQLGLLPLIEAGAVELGDIIADCKSGVSGAGREAKVGSLFCEASDSFKAYGVSGHRHLPEIAQGLTQMAGQAVGLTFVPHLVPMNRGIHATLYARLTDPAIDLQSIYEKRFNDEPFVDLLAAGEHPETRGVRASNQCRIAVHRQQGGRTAIVLSVIDNLVKGASGQAVQNLNLMFGFDERCGLDAPPLAP
ncbi:N-acetyl-gamma-glutamyl-phosphate reductase [Sinimarinibacterium sp. CAU 1509]|uniref:N-acetyl-gamma-glutamyl-phosphate reductase n=1 Tax=Sinimarinibacterium sp. CAU 1509 TaxID=2562283 RepID=UPI0010AC7344|nr:N-acetyl-gamma-glutamyl-phosphate reductase [Sinimarinibacterium sp. CAU 1509]TJY64857.1 N-acetyl-gamma-glutamyl-phosphate reductase [Sinimarinibacterium sp. CAU 1509]